MAAQMAAAGCETELCCRYAVLTTFLFRNRVRGGNSKLVAMRDDVIPVCKPFADRNGEVQHEIQCIYCGGLPWMRGIGADAK
jgi:hypothetical protein